MHTSAAGLRLLASREGLRTRAYQDSIGVWTIGVGHTSAAGPPKVVPGLTLSTSECLTLLNTDIVHYEQSILRALPNVNLSQNEFDALVSLCYNIGPGNFAKSGVVKYLLAGDRPHAAAAFLGWNKAGGKVLSGLTTRRQSEKKQFLTPDPVSTPEATHTAPTPVDAPVITQGSPPVASTIPSATPVAKTKRTLSAAFLGAMAWFHDHWYYIAAVGIVCLAVYLFMKYKK